MAKTTLISLRMEQSILDKISKIIDGKPYWSRTLVINRILSAALDPHNTNFVYSLLLCYDPDTADITLKGKIEDCKNDPKFI